MKTNDPNNVSDRLHKAVALETDLVNRQLRHIGLNNQQARLLKFVSEHPGVIQKEVATFLNRQNATITNMLKAMVKQGYLTRKIPVDNERQKKLYLEPKGEELITSINLIFAELEQQITAAIPPAERADFIKNLDRIKQALS
ncbi:MarR family transcriptional regulator [Loigolactobacillus coryniformis]|uniref:MarR family winged helix-turn-helix transcriptional regulator n=1 Tax=Loigolactobacillus jiayinensis TaxID=2486016 RepID=A0ABW1RJ73_9LACO|nr:MULTISPECIES: MarR family transcriptional regulator [Loigolactobacillus]MDC4186784.1 MarR family transcriptional regulator [Loigolactobacillus coryniformis]